MVDAAIIIVDILSIPVNCNLEIYKHHLLQLLIPHLTTLYQITTITYKSTQSNLGRGPRRCESKSPSVTMARPKFAPKSTPSRGPIPKSHYVSHPWTCPTYDAKRHPDPIRRFSTMHWTDRRTYARTHRQTDRSSTGKFDDYRPLSLTTATRPNNNSNNFLT